MALEDTHCLGLLGEFSPVPELARELDLPRPGAGKQQEQELRLEETQPRGRPVKAQREKAGQWVAPGPPLSTCFKILLYLRIPISISPDSSLPLFSVLHLLLLALPKS